MNGASNVSLKKKAFDRKVRKEFAKIAKDADYEPVFC
jgi:hypothetical protein